MFAFALCRTARLRAYRTLCYVQRLGSSVDCQGLTLHGCVELEIIAFKLGWLAGGFGVCLWGQVRLKDDA